MSAPLAAARSAYLRSAAHQPVRWHPWGPEPFELAAAEEKPILLDIGAAWCHWCHVMDHESYENPEIADFLNRHFVAIKVDRDERPDVDSRYQRAVQALIRQGGWPLTAFLNPRGEVFFGGTYFPPDGRDGRPGFLSVLRRVVHVWQAEPERVAVQAARLREFVADTLDEATGGTADRVVFDAALDRILEAADLEHGGFGTAPKFPHPGAVSLLLDRWRSSGEGRARDAAIAALDGMARGGFRDQVAGGFHRYATDRRWLVPHFEKMTSDNAELLRCFVKAARILGRPADREVVSDTLRWVRETLADPAGGYGASQDADLGAGDDGAAFTWSVDELARALDPGQLEVVTARYGVGTDARMPHDPGRNVLYQARSIEAVAAEIGRAEGDVEEILTVALTRLRAARAARPAPFVDPTRYAAWNAMMAAAVLDAGILLDDRWATDHAVRSLERLRSEQPAPDLIRHGADGATGLLEDQVQVATAALDLFEYSGDRTWLDWAAALARRVLADLWDRDGGGFYDRPAEPTAQGLLADRAKSIQDSPNASPNGVAGIVLARLRELTGDPSWEEPFRRLIDAFADRAEALGIHGATYLTAMEWALEPPARLVVTGPATDPVAMALHRAALDAPLPRRVLTRLVPGAPPPAPLTPALAAVVRSVDRPIGYLCLGDRCLEPATDPGRWRAQLAGQAD